jgi:subtilisin family serine protease
LNNLGPRLIAAFTLTLLAACTQLTSSPPGDANLSQSTVYMKGVLSKQIAVQATGAWTISSSSHWLSVTPNSGNGDEVVRLTVDPGSLTPGEYSTMITLDPSDSASSSEYTEVVFAFPRIRGSVVMGPSGTTSLSLLSAEAVTSGPGRLLVGVRDLPSSPSTRAASRLGAGDKASEFRQLAAGLAASGRGMRVHQAHPLSKVVVLEVEDMRAAMELLQGDPNVRYVEPEGTLELLASNDTHRDKQWALDTIRVDDAWVVGDGTGTRVAIIDAGFHPSHEDYFGNVAETFDFITGKPEISDRPSCGSHGDHVAGTVAATTNNLKGVAGVAPNAQLVLLNVGYEKVVNDTVQCVLDPSAVLAALKWVTGDGTGPRADIVNMSLGGNHTSAMEDVVKSVYSAGITMVAAAGNDPNGGVLFPAAYPQVIAVSATGKEDEIASYSTTGPQIFVGAPGGNAPNYILSTVWNYPDSVNSSAYGYMQGTSMASPATAAVAALIKSVNSGLTPMGIAGLLADSSQDLLPQGRDDSFGYGRIDAYAAVMRAEEKIGEPTPTGYVLRGDTFEEVIPVVEKFVAGYAGGRTTLQAGSDDNWNGVLDDSGEYYGSITIDVPFDGEFFDVEIPVEKQQP